MNRKLLFAIIISTSAAIPGFAQGGNTATKTKRPRVIVTENIPVASPTPESTERKVLMVPSASPSNGSKVQTPAPVTENKPSNDNSQPSLFNPQARSLSYIQTQSKLEEAKRQMQTRPLRISLGEETQNTEVVRIAFFDWNNQKIDYAVISKTTFLGTDSDAVVRTENEQTVRIRTIRGNGVNTPVMVFDMYNRAHLPLIVQYPIEKFGRFQEMAYYVSTHPGIVTAENVNAGRSYLANVLDAAREKLRKKGIFIQPKVVDIAERLALVEHVDHLRFRTENHPKIYNDVYTLYALNEGQTYRYSVSSAGAGGMVQMIPSTYRMIRSRYYQVGLDPDFVSGMRDHQNAAQAMLLYMQMTWNDLLSNSTVRDAMDQRIATQEQLMAAGYNSNPSRLPGYIKRGGAGWTNLIPRETKIYLQIFESVERYVPMAPRNR